MNIQSAINRIRRNRQPKKPNGPGPHPPEHGPASAETVAALCAEANLDRLAHPMIRERLTLDQIRGRLDNARGVRDAFAAAGITRGLDTALDSGIPADFARRLLVDATAAASEDEIDHHLPEDNPHG